MRFKEETRCSSVMVARAAENNPSIFRSVSDLLTIPTPIKLSSLIVRQEGPLPLSDLVREYVKLAVQYDNYIGNTKYCLCVYKLEQADTRQLQGAKSLKDIW